MPSNGLDARNGRPSKFPDKMCGSQRDRAMRFARFGAASQAA
jgi:hypothetical protein